MVVGGVYFLYAVAIVIAMGTPEYIPETIIVCLSLHFAGLLYGLAMNSIIANWRYVIAATGTGLAASISKPFTLYPDSVSPEAEIVDGLQVVAFIFTILHVSGGLEVPLAVLYVFCLLLLFGIGLCWKKVLSKYTP
tara:strand:+ start:230 stop:637 length:408 start_codon:yes stop_codon:yes gene_type:complete